jgi:hypothetical protein
VLVLLDWLKSRMSKMNSYPVLTLSGFFVTSLNFSLHGESIKTYFCGTLLTHVNLFFEYFNSCLSSGMKT